MLWWEIKREREKGRRLGRKNWRLRVTKMGSWKEGFVSVEVREKEKKLIIIAPFNTGGSIIK